MKRAIMAICLAGMICNSRANLDATESFVIVGDETYFCESIYTGPSSFRITTTDGDDMKISTGRIDAYSYKGSYFEKMPVIDKNKDTAGWAFMQYLTSRDGFKLYRYCSTCTNFDPATGEIAPRSPIYRYYIFKDSKFVSVTDDHNVKPILKRFGVRVLI
jgi:hypothetical protein